MPVFRLLVPSFILPWVGSGACPICRRGCLKNRRVAEVGSEREEGDSIMDQATNVETASHRGPPAHATGGLS